MYSRGVVSSSLFSSVTKPLPLDNVTGAIDFGVCRAGGKYERVVNIINMGNVEYAFELLPDPHDLLLNPRHKPPDFSWQRVAESNGCIFGGISSKYLQPQRPVLYLKFSDLALQHLSPMLVIAP